MSEGLHFVQCLNSTEDADRAFLIEEMFKILKEAIVLDFRFLNSQGEESFIHVLEILNAAYVESCDNKVKAEVIDILLLIFF